MGVVIFQLFLLPDDTIDNYRIEQALAIRCTRLDTKNHIHTVKCIERIKAIFHEFYRY